MFSWHWCEIRKQHSLCLSLPGQICRADSWKMIFILAHKVPSVNYLTTTFKWKKKIGQQYYFKIGSSYKVIISLKSTSIRLFLLLKQTYLAVCKCVLYDVQNWGRKGADTLQRHTLLQRADISYTTRQSFQQLHHSLKARIDNNNQCFSLLK